MVAVTAIEIIKNLHVIQHMNTLLTENNIFQKSLSPMKPILRKKNPEKLKIKKKKIPTITNFCFFIFFEAFLCNARES